MECDSANLLAELKKSDEIHLDISEDIPDDYYDYLINFDIAIIYYSIGGSSTYIINLVKSNVLIYILQRIDGK